MKAKLIELIEHWERLAFIAEELANKPPSDAPATYGAACRGNKDAYKDCARDLRHALGIKPAKPIAARNSQTGGSA